MKKLFLALAASWMLALGLSMPVRADTVTLNPSAPVVVLPSNVSPSGWMIQNQSTSPMSCWRQASATPGAVTAAPDLIIAGPTPITITDALNLLCWNGSATRVGVNAAPSAGGGGGGAGDASAANQTVVQALPGSDGAKAIAVQGVTGGKAVPVSGPLTDTQLRASAVPVSGTITSNVGTGTRPVAGNVAAGTTDSGNPVKIGGLANSSFPSAVSTGQRVDNWLGLNGQQVISFPPAAANSGDAIANAANTFTDVQGNELRLRVRPEGFDGTNWNRLRVGTDNSLQTFVPDITASGTITTQNLVPAGVATAGSAVEITTAGCGGITTQITGTYTGALSAQGTVDGTTWVTLGGTPFLNVNTGALSATIASATQGIFQIETLGFQKVRLTGLAAMTGTATVTLRAALNTPMVTVDAPLPTGTNSIGNIGSITTLPTLATVTTVGTVTTMTTGNVQPLPQTGLFINSAATTNATSVKASAGQLLTFTLSNNGAAAAFVKFYNKASAPTVGTDTPVFVITVPATSYASVPLGFAGQQFPTGIALAITNLIADTDTTAVAAGQVKIALTYK